MSQRQVLAGGWAIGAVALGLSAAHAQPARDARYRVGPGDVLSVEVVGRPELSTAPAVRPDGRIRLLDGQSLAVAELTTGEIARAVTAALRRSTPPPGDLEVRVAVHEYRSRFVSVEGAVVRPGRVALRGSTRLVDILVDAGGFAPGATGEVVILRRSDDAPLRRLTVEVPARLAATGLVNLGQPLEHGDRVAVLLAQQVAVGGAVRRPGIYLLRDAPTLLSVLGLAGGTERYARFALLDRRRGGDLEVALEPVRRGETPDPALAPGDAVTVR